MRVKQGSNIGRTHYLNSPPSLSHTFSPVKRKHHNKRPACLSRSPPPPKLTHTVSLSTMGSKPMRDTKMVSRRARKGLVAISHKRICRRQNSRTSIHYVNDDRSPNFASSVTDKLEALKKLIPVAVAVPVVVNNNNINNEDDIKATDQLFKQTADYILLLRTQVSILQGLVDFYEDGSSAHDSQNI